MSWGRKPSSERVSSQDVAQREGFRCSTILFIPLRVDPCNPDFNWDAAGNEPIPRRCPKCLGDSITGHGRRSKQAHDETHDWIEIRRGICRPCHLTFTFLFSLFLTPTSVCSHAARHCDYISWSTGRWKTQHRPSRILIASLTLLPSAVGSAAWIPRSLPFPSCAAPCESSPTGWHAESSSSATPCAYLGQPSFPFCRSFGPCASETP